MKNNLTLLKQRKHPRLKEYDYSDDGYYFITFCTHNKRNMLGYVKHNNMFEDSYTDLSTYGKIVNEIILDLQNYKTIKIDKYVIMPNHIHMLLIIDNNYSNNAKSDIMKFVSLLKSNVTKRIGENIWQTSFYEHIIRNEEAYKNIWTYIDQNPNKWDIDDLNKWK